MSLTRSKYRIVLRCMGGEHGQRCRRNVQQITPSTRAIQLVHYCRQLRYNAWCSALRGAVLCVVQCSAWCSVLRGAVLCVVQCSAWCVQCSALRVVLLSTVLLFRNIILIIRIHNASTN